MSRPGELIAEALMERHAAAQEGREPFTIAISRQEADEIMAFLGGPTPAAPTVNRLGGIRVQIVDVEAAGILPLPPARALWLDRRPLELE